MSESFAGRLKAEREAKGWTQSYLASLVGVTNGTISGYEREYREPDIKTLLRLAEVFEVSVDYLLGKSNLRNYKPSQVLENNLQYRTRENANSQFTDLPEEARKAIAEFICFIREKYAAK